MEKQPIKLSIKKEDGSIIILESSKVIETISIDETVDFGGTIDRLLEDNFENTFLLEKNNDLDATEKDAIDFLSRIIEAYNQKVQEWTDFKNGSEGNSSGENTLTETP